MRLKDWGKGWNADQPPWELAPGFWNNVQNARFRNGKAERVSGIASVATPSVAVYALGVFQVGGSATTTRFTIEVGIAKVYAWDGSVRTEITRGLNGSINAISGDGTTVTVTTSPAHGLTTGDNVIITGVLPAGYNTLTAGVTITVTGATTFTYLNGTSAASTFAGYWHSNRTSNFTTTAGDEISVFSLNGILYVNTIKEGAYYWGGSTSSGAQGRLRRLNSGVSTGQSYPYGRVARPYKDFVMMMGYFPAGALTSASSTRSPYTIGWGSSADPGSVPSTFTAAASNDAGSVQKTRGAGVDGLEWAGTFYAYFENAFLAVDWIGGNDVFSTTRWVSESSGLLAPNCVVNCDKGQVFLSQNYDVLIHQGGTPQSLADGRVWGWIKSNIDTTNANRSFLSVNRRYNEVWVCIPTSGNTTPNKALVWNWADDTWGQRDLPANVTCGVNGMLPTTVATDDRLILATTTPAVGLVDSGTTDLGASYTTTLERTGMDMDEPSYKMISRSMPLFDGTTAFTASIFHGAGSTQDATPTYASAATYTHNTSTWVNAFSTSGRFLAYKITSTASDPWTLRTIELDIKKQGGF